MIRLDLNTGPKHWHVSGMDPFAAYAIKMMATTRGQTISTYLYDAIREHVLDEGGDLLRLLNQYEAGKGSKP